MGRTRSPGAGWRWAGRGDRAVRGSRAAGGSRDGREEGSGSILIVAVVASLLLLTGLALPLNQALTVRQQVANAADAAALAAADTASGVVAGIPCENAAEAARLNGSVLGDCTIDGVEARVIATRSVLGLTVSVASRAGQPPGEVAGGGRGPPG
ncbi:Rv3654c family TadE-like protein [Mycetocola zhujimingii]|uniref:Rv3654c family TadE-like protein n=1 Tax=Mycetocola zhujimingii TaxID=2079792 RepID=UPI000D36E146|nr:Rv3654c family TadE-like protein [Mycetocola zhujimingii]AWB85712.1 hypothetical protein C3E77_03160 [Mycetocola zhujimingii]